MAQLSNKKRKLRIDFIQNLDQAIKHLQENDINQEQTVLQCFEVIKGQIRGLSPNDITNLIDLICNKKMIVSQQRGLIKSLIPETVVPASAAVKAVLAICGRNIAAATKTHLLKWMISVYQNDLLDDKKELHKLYDALFTCLNCERIAPHLSHLLYHLTMKEDVTGFRVSYIQDLITKYGPQPYLLCLWKCYYRFRKDITFPIEGEAYFLRDDFWDTVFDGVLFRLGKSSKISINPEKKKKRKISVTDITDNQISDLSNLQELIEHVESKMTVQKVASSHVQRRIIFSSCTERFIKRFNFWFASASEEVWNSSNAKATGANPLAILRKLCLELPCTFPEAGAFLFDYLQEWDGVKMFKEVSLLIPCILPCTIQELSPVLLKLHELHECSNLDFQCLVIALLSELFRTWILHGAYNIDPDNSLFEVWDDTTFMLGNYIDRCCVITIELNPSSHTLVLNCAFDFYFEVAQLVYAGKSNVFLIPSPTIVYLALFSLSGYLLSRLCQLFLIFERTVEKLKKRNADPLMGSEGIKSINAYIKDIYHVLWHGQPFHSKGPSSLYRSKLPSCIFNTLFQSAGEAFTLLRHPALSSITYEFAKTQDHNWTQNKRDVAIRESFIQHLYFEKQLRGIFKFFE